MWTLTVDVFFYETLFAARKVFSWFQLILTFVREQQMAIPKLWKAPFNSLLDYDNH